MSSSTTGKTTKLNWKLSLLLGLLTGGVLGAGIQHYNNVPVTTAYSTLKSDYQSVVDELNKEKLSVKQLTDEKALLVESSNQKLEALNLQLDQQKDQLKQLTEQLVTIKKQQETTQKLVVTKKKLNKEVVALKTKAKQQKEVIDNSNVLFEQKSKTQHDLAVVQKQIATLSPEIKKTKKACAEFKSGNSWNWVSQKDCDNYEALQQKLSKLKAQESQLKQSLATINKKING